MLTLNLLLVNDLGNEVVVVLLLEVIKGLFATRLLFELLDLHLVMVELVLLGIPIF